MSDPNGFNPDITYTMSETIPCRQNYIDEQKKPIENNKTNQNSEKTQITTLLSMQNNFKRSPDIPIIKTSTDKNRITPLRYKSMGK